MSYLFTAFLPTDETPSANEARAYLLEGALFDVRPTITITNAGDGSFDLMELRYSRDRSPMNLRRLRAEQAEMARQEAVDAAEACGHSDLAASIGQSRVVLEWDVDRAELDEDAWFALHLWQAWLLGPSNGWLYAPGDGLFDSQLKRLCKTP